MKTLALALAAAATLAFTAPSFAASAAPFAASAAPFAAGAAPFAAGAALDRIQLAQADVNVRVGDRDHDRAARHERREHRVHRDERREHRMHREVRMHRDYGRHEGWRHGHHGKKVVIIKKGHGRTVIKKKISHG